MLKKLVSVILVPAALVMAALTGMSAPVAAAAGGTSTAGDRVLTAADLEGLSLRCLGPALRPGRVADIEIHPRDRSVWYLATSSSGLWKTENRGIRWEPIFDDGGSYSLGCVVVDPANPDTVWLGTGENSSNRSVGYGDGIYKSPDGGKTWRRMGLEDSQHIARILIDPRDSDVVYAAAEGPLWSPGGDRGLFKTTDGGETWQAVLEISENTGVTDAVLDPRDPDVIYAASFQRRRQVGQLIGGGPESALYKSTDGGGTWTTLTNGIPDVDKGRIALALSPQDPDVAYALITAAGKESGFFRSTDRGETWTRRSSYSVLDPQYYGNIYADPRRFDRIFAVDTVMTVSEDGGRHFERVEWDMHVDYHCMAFDPADPDHLLVGNDGGLYESYDNGLTWRHFANLPTSQFYRVAVDDVKPFYYVHGGTQDNGSMSGPSRTLNAVGIRTSDWIRTGGGDGFQSRVEPGNPDIIYSMSQNGVIRRLDTRTGLTRDIRPRVEEGQPAVRWHWDTPFLISPHSPTRLYFAGSRLFRSDDRGDGWRPVSPDLTRRLDPDKIPVMGRLWGDDALQKNRFTTALSVSSALDESPLREDLLIIGTDDGLIRISRDGGESWDRAETFPGIPEWSYVADVCASRHDENRFYAAFNNWQRGDFHPYLSRSDDSGKSWTSIAGNLPERHVVWSVAEDHIDPDLLFAGTEFGLFFTRDGGKHWVRLKGGAPTIPFRDLVVQRREGDLVAATFGRGFYVLDDYSPLRHLGADTMETEAALFPPREALLYSPRGYVTAADGDFTTPNPPFGALLTYFLRDDPDRGGKAEIRLTIKNPDGTIIRRISGPAAPGLHRVSWDLRHEPEKADPGSRRRPRPGPLVEPGSYTIELNRITPEGERIIGRPQTLMVKPLEESASGNHP